MEPYSFGHCTLVRLSRELLTHSAILFYAYNEVEKWIAKILWNCALFKNKLNDKKKSQSFNLPYNIVKVLCVFCIVCFIHVNLIVYVQLMIMLMMATDRLESKFYGNISLVFLSYDACSAIAALLSMHMSSTSNRYWIPAVHWIRIRRRVGLVMAWACLFVCEFVNRFYCINKKSASSLERNRPKSNVDFFLSSSTSLLLLSTSIIIIFSSHRGDIEQPYRGTAYGAHCRRI